MNFIGMNHVSLCEKSQIGLSVWVQILLSVPKSYHNITFFLFFLTKSFLPCKDIFVDDYDGI